MSQIYARVEHFAARLLDWKPASWLVGLMVAVVGWQPGFVLPFAGIDASWWAGLYMGLENDLQWGSEIVFTYGPLGFLRLPWLFFAGLSGSISFAWSALLFVGLCVALVATLRRRVNVWLAAAVTLLVVVQLDRLEVSTALAILAAMLIIARPPGQRGMLLFAITAGALAAAEMLVKLSSGPVIAIVLLLGLFGARARWRDLLAFAASFVIVGISCWLLAGQAPGQFPEFVGNSMQIISGYSPAMSLHDGSPLLVLCVVVTALATVAWAAWGEYPDRRARMIAVLVVALVTFAFYKQAVVRMDRSHLAIFFAVAAVLWISVPVKRSLNVFSLGGLAGLAAISIYALGVTPSPGLNPIENVKGLITNSATALSVDRQRNQIESSRLLLRYSYGLPEQMRDSIGKDPVSVEPWEVAAAWAFDFDWSPAPVFQNYSAYTPRLDRLNSEAISSADGPRWILRHVGEDSFRPGAGIDDRFLAWDPPSQAVATLCHFSPDSQSPRWQLLLRVPERCGPMVPEGGIDTAFGEPVKVPVPGPDEVVLVKISAPAPGPLASLKSLLFRPDEWRADVGDVSYRVISATAGDGLMLRMGDRLAEGKGRFAQVPQAAAIKLTGGSGELSLDFFSFRVREAGPGKP